MPGHHAYSSLPQRLGVLLLTLVPAPVIVNAQNTGTEPCAVNVQRGQGWFQSGNVFQTTNLADGEPACLVIPDVDTRYAEIVTSIEVILEPGFDFLRFYYFDDDTDQLVLQLEYTGSVFDTVTYTGGANAPKNIAICVEKDEAFAAQGERVTVEVLSGQCYTAATETDPVTETSTVTGTETGTDTGSETSTETGTMTGTETGTETGSKTGTQADTENEAGTGTGNGNGDAEIAKSSSDSASVGLIVGIALAVAAVLAAAVFGAVVYRRRRERRRTEWSPSTARPSSASAPPLPPLLPVASSPSKKDSITTMPTMSTSSHRSVVDIDSAVGYAHQPLSGRPRPPAQMQYLDIMNRDTSLSEDANQVNDDFDDTDYEEVPQHRPPPPTYWHSMNKYEAR
eukprot:Clim_evm13s233 gene=Clim_evmTU13s233